MVAQQVFLPTRRPAAMGKVNEADLDWDVVERNGTGWREKGLADAAGGERLGCSLYELQPGKRSWPYHYHTANEEALFVLEGTGSLRLAGETGPIETGDYVTFPADERGAHRVVNDGDGLLRYFMVSTRVTPDVTVYPDSEKIGALTRPSDDGSSERSVSGFYRLDDAIGYWDGEDE